MLVARLVLLEKVYVLQQAAGRAHRDHGRALACRLCRTAAVSPRNVARRRLGGRERGLRCGVRCAGLALRLEQQVAPPHLPVCLRSPGTAPDSAGARTSYVRHSCSAGTRESHLSLFGLPFTLLIRVLGLVARHLQAVLAPVHVPRLLRQDVQAACSTALWLSNGVAQSRWSAAANKLHQRTVSAHGRTACLLAPGRPQAQPCRWRSE